MRILGFSKKWDKLSQPVFTTFRFSRKDRDWEVGEDAKVMLKPRSKGGGEFMGVAKIINREQRWVMNSPVPIKEGVTIDCVDAKVDGFDTVRDMVTWVSHTHQARNFKEPMNKLTLKWI